MPARAPRRFMHHWVLAVGLLATFAVALGLYLALGEHDREQFANAVESTQDRIQGRIDDYVIALLGVRGLLSVTPDVSAAEFRRYINELQVTRRYPGIQGIGFSRRVTAAERARVEEELRRTLRPDFHIWPDAPRDEYYTIVFLEPLDRRNQAAIGFDMHAEPTRREAMDRARDDGAPAATHRVTLVQEIEAETQPGFLLYLPVYAAPAATVDERRRALRGFVYAPFRVADFLTGLFGREHDPRVELSVYDGAEIREQALLHRSAPAAELGRSARFTTTTTLDVAGARWTIVYRSRPGFEAASDHEAVLVLLGIGVAATFGLFFATRSQVRARSREEHARADAEAQRNNLHDLLMQAPAAIAIIRGSELRYELSNSTNVAFSGGRAVVGTTVGEALPELEAQGLTAMVRNVLRTGDPVVGRELPVRLVDADGGTRDVFITGTYQPLHGPGGVIDGVMAFAYEVTDQVLARRSVEKLAEDLRKAVRVRDDFLSIAGHELRTPLTALTLQIQSLLRAVRKSGVPASGPPSWPSNAIDRLEKAASQIERLDRLVRELLDVSRITSGRLALALALEDVDLVELLREVVERFDEQLRRARCAVSVRAPERLAGRWDRVRVDQVLTNLIGNAIKYGPQKPIEIEVEAGTQAAKVTVRDRGIGIAPEHAGRIFERFGRAVPERNYGGLGLGLWICREIVQALGGRIWFQSTPGEGSAFSFEIPYRPSEGEGEGEGEAGAGATSPDT